MIIIRRKKFYVFVAKKIDKWLVIINEMYDDNATGFSWLYQEIININIKRW